MQLKCETLTIDEAIAELERVIPLTAMVRVIEFRVKQHKSRAAYRRRLEVMRADQIATETRA